LQIAISVHCFHTFGVSKGAPGTLLVFKVVTMAAEKPEEQKPEEQKGSFDTRLGSSSVTSSYLAPVGTTGDDYTDKIIERLNPEGREGEIEDYYQLEEKLGEGAFAKVFKGIEKGTGKEFAIKIIDLEEKDDAFSQLSLKRPTLIGSSEALAKRREVERKKKLRRKVRILENEIAVMRRIASMPPKRRKALVKITDQLANSRKICFCMELLTGGELFDRVQMKQNYTERDAAHLMRRMMKGVRSLHKAGIIHRDLKPENLVFETQYDDSRVKITDFGLATVMGRPDIFRKIVVGSPGYIAPEIIISKEYTPACDIWSMGCILFILLVGGPPFGGKTNQELFENIKKGKYHYPPDTNISDEAKDLIAKMLNLNHEERITANGVLQHPWVVKKAQYADLHNAAQKLRAFNTRRKLKAVAVAMVWGGKSTYSVRLRQLLQGTSKEDGFSGDELVSLRDRLFIRGNENKLITQKAFVDVFESMGWSDLPLIDMFDIFKGENDMAEVPEICIGMSTTGNEWNGNAALRFCFDSYDRDGTGSIAKDDVMKILKVLMGEAKFNKIASAFKSMFDGYFFKSKKVSYNDFVSKFIKYGDFSFREKIAQPVQQLIKRATMLGRNRLSSALSLATVKSSRLSNDDNMAQMLTAAAEHVAEEEHDTNEEQHNLHEEDSDSDEDDSDDEGSIFRKGSRRTQQFMALTLGRKKKKKKSSSFEDSLKRKLSVDSSRRKTSKAEAKAESLELAKEEMRNFKRKNPVPPKGPKPRRGTEESGWSMEKFNVEDEV